MIVPSVWPVIHVTTPAIVLQNAHVAKALRCEGVMLISMRGKDDDTIAVARVVRRTIPDLKIGINMLRSPSAEALLISQREGFDATWSDRQDFYNGAIYRDALNIVRYMRPDHLFFAAVAFKGQPDDPVPGLSAKLAVQNGVIPTTSGPATGAAIDVRKLRAIREELSHTAPLAVASGVTPDNIRWIAPYVTHVLVSTGISSAPAAPDVFDPNKLDLLLIRRRRLAEV